MTPTPPSILEIDLNAIAANWRALAARHPGQTAAVVKADAYGLGAAAIVQKLFAAGCTNFFTAHLEEALAIRPLIRTANLMVLHGILPGEAAIFAEHNVIPVISSIPELAQWSAEAKFRSRVLPAFLQFDTGMSRLGLSPAEFTYLREHPALLSGVAVTHIMTHLVNAERPTDEMNEMQLKRIQNIKMHFPKTKLSLANSSGLFLEQKFASDLARPGAAIYGLNPTPGRPNPMQTTIRLLGRILAIRTIETGTPVGYNGIWTAPRTSRIATVAVGYADGYFRRLGNRTAGYVIKDFDVHPAPLVGRVSMDLTTFDITGIPNVEIGDVLELIGQNATPDDLALAATSNGYEILTSLGKRFHRQYTGAF
jgi:alanine racemase